MISERCVSEYCYEDPSLIANYDKAIADTKQIWHCHHRVETIMNCNAEELKAKGCYENRPAHELVFLTPSEHSRLHNEGKTLSEETRAKLRKPKSAETRAKIGAAKKGKPRSEDTRSKLSASIKAALSRPEVRANMRAAMNKPETRAKRSASIKAALSRPEVRAKVHATMSSPEMRAKKSALSAGNHWFNNGIKNKFCKECPGPEWKRGRLRNKQS